MIVWVENVMFYWGYFLEESSDISAYALDKNLNFDVPVEI